MPDNHPDLDPFAHRDDAPEDDPAIRLANQLDATTDENIRLRAENRALRDCLEGMAWQFGLLFEQTGERWLGTAGLSNLEWAFDVLGWDDPHPFPVDAPKRFR